MFENFSRFARANRNKSRSSRSKYSPHRRLRGMEGLEPRQMMSAVPAYSSMPEADVTIYLDFDGHFEADWGYEGGDIWHDCETPVFSLDNNEDFNATELQWIHNIWKIVAEDFSPFNINVTTVKPPEFGLNAGFRVAIGGGYDDWYLTDVVGGISFGGSYASGLTSTAYVFTEQFHDARGIGDAVSHEVGHAFGLEHQSLWNNYDGSLIEEYNPGNSYTAPIMGRSYDAARGLWWDDDLGQNGWGGQDDINVMTQGQNFFSFREDDHGDTYQTATLMSSYLAVMKGIISSNETNYLVGEDVDCFRVNLSELPLNQSWYVNVDVDDYSANLDVKLEIYKVSPGGGQYPLAEFIGTADPSDDLDALLSFKGGGEFAIYVRSHGGYGDLGQYTLSVNKGSDGRPDIILYPMPDLIDIICDPSLPIARPGGIVISQSPILAQPSLPTINEKLVLNKTTNLVSGKSIASGESLAKKSSLNLASIDLQTLDAAFGDFAVGLKGSLLG